MGVWSKFGSSCCFYLQTQRHAHSSRLRSGAELHPFGRHFHVLRCHVCPGPEAHQHCVRHPAVSAEVPSQMTTRHTTMPLSAFDRFGVGFCFTVVYAALLTKTNRIARIFKAGKQSAKRPSFISPKSQLVICTCLVSVQVSVYGGHRAMAREVDVWAENKMLFYPHLQILINGVWMVIAPSHAMHHYPTREDNLLVCDSYIDASYMIAFFYPIVLIIICTVYAVLTRKIPEAFNESKHIGMCLNENV